MADAGITQENWRQRLPNPHRSDGVWLKVDRRGQGGTYRGKVCVEAQRCALPWRATPQLAAEDVDK
jgi:hypothetical protein